MLIAYVPNKYFETFLTLLYEIDQQISKYIKGIKKIYLHKNMDSW